MFTHKTLLRGLVIATSICCLRSGGDFTLRGAEAVPAADTPQTYFVTSASPYGNGESRAAAADFRDSKFWTRVNQAIQLAPVVVNFLDGGYIVSSDPSNGMPSLHLADLGHETHLLTLQGESEKGVVFTRLASDSRQGTKGPGFLKISGSQNVVVRNLHFTGSHPIGYATHFGGNERILLERCSWIDLPGVYYGASGTAGSSTNGVTFAHCVFQRVGSGGHAHMVYNAGGATHVQFINCHFEDCAGDYVRFRSGADFGVVFGCTFKSTGKYRNSNAPFISIPLFNDSDPDRESGSAGFEYFGTHFLIGKNVFEYANSAADGARIGLLFHHSGFDPPGRHHLLTPDQAEVLKSGGLVARRGLMLERFGVDANTVHFFDNRFEGVEQRVAYRSHAAYGAQSKGWKGIVDISDTINDSIVCSDSRGAQMFFPTCGKTD
jgi:hypothetical protein